MRARTASTTRSSFASLCVLGASSARRAVRAAGSDRRPRAVRLRRAARRAAPAIRETACRRSSRDRAAARRPPCDLREVAVRLPLGGVMRRSSFASRLRRIVSTVVYARSAGSLSRTSDDRARARSHNTPITSSSRSPSTKSSMDHPVSTNVIVGYDDAAELSTTAIVDSRDRLWRMTRHFASPRWPPRLCSPPSRAVAAQSPRGPPSPDRSAAELHRLVRRTHRHRRASSSSACIPTTPTPQLITWLSRGRNVETAYLSVTRGEAGEDFNGPQSGRRLGGRLRSHAGAARRAPHRRRTSILHARVRLRTSTHRQ